jgi:hypothetical protein
MPIVMNSGVLDAAFSFVDAQDVATVLDQVTSGWNLRIAASDARPALFTIRGTRRGYVIREPGFRALHEPTAVGAACSLIKAVLNRAADREPDRLLLHAAAVAAEGRTIVFPSTHRSGKSTLAAALALAGHTVVAEDILPLGLDGDGIEAIAAGVAPRLRLPLPNVTGALNLSARDAIQGYADMPTGALRPFGERSKIGAFVLLERSDGDVGLHPIGPSDLTRVLLAQSFGGAVDAGRTLDMLSRAANLAPGFVLRYQSVDDAVATIAGGLVTTAAPRAPTPPCRTEQPRRVPTTGALVRRSDVERRERNRSAFLIDHHSGRIFGLDPLGDAIWEILSSPSTADEIVEDVIGSLPSTDAGRVGADVRSFVATLYQNGLVVPSPET